MPYAHLLINDQHVVTDQNGWFSIKSINDSIFQLSATYLGFKKLDTTLYAASHIQINLLPESYKLNEITVHTKPFESVLSYSGNVAGEVKLSNYITSYLPGNGDNSVFNLLRLQPGVLAAGEQSSDLLIWGSFEGQSLLLFDGMTLFAMKNYNDNISAVNPFLAKSVKVLKGAYGVEYNGVVGGVVDVTGVQGNREDFSAQLNVNNQTLNGMLSIPLFKKSSLVIAARKTYYEMYDQSSISFNVGRNDNNTMDQVLYPDYNFQDLNLKFSGELNERNQFQISGFYGADNFTYGLDIDGTNSRFQYEQNENHGQLGGSFQWNHHWKNGANTRLIAARSYLNRSIHNLQKTSNGRSSGGNGQFAASDFSTTVDDQIENNAIEQKIKIETTHPVIKNHQLKWGLGVQNYQANYHEDSIAITTYHSSNQVRLLHGYINDEISLNKQLQFEIGLLNEYALDLNKNLLLPRIHLQYKLSDQLQLNYGSGCYSQYLTQLTQIDDFSTIRYFWLIADGKNVSMQKALHNVVGVKFTQPHWQANVEYFNKQMNGLTRYYNYSFQSTPFNGESYSNGFDILLNAHWEHLQFWTAYTFSKTYEHFDYFANTDFQRALHDQRHELKLTMLVDLRNWFITANYVYGSGFPDLIYENAERDYHRFDVAVTKSFYFHRFKVETGLSILNVLNYQNIKYDNFYRLPDETGTLSLQAEAVPFTPTLYLNLSF